MQRPKSNNRRLKSNISQKPSARHQPPNSRLAILVKVRAEASLKRLDRRPGQEQEAVAVGGRAVGSRELGSSQ